MSTTRRFTNACDSVKVILERAIQDLTESEQTLNEAVIDYLDERPDIKDENDFCEARDDNLADCARGYIEDAVREIESAVFQIQEAIELAEDFETETMRIQPG